jgi:opacity protein-like surface antigen
MALSLGLCCLASAEAADRDSTEKKNFYLKAGLGIEWSHKYKSKVGLHEERAPKRSPVYSLSFGYKIDSALRSDISLQYLNVRYNKPESFGYREFQDTKCTSIMGNIYYDFLSRSQIRPYLKAGVGISRNVAGNFKAHLPLNGRTVLTKGKITYAPAWNVGLGITHAYNNNFHHDLGYSYAFYGKFKMKGRTDEDTQLTGGSQVIRGHQLTYSIRYNF